MKRPRQHEIDELGKRQFQQSLPPNYLVRFQQEDYGIDGEVEVFNKGETTGIIFKFQLKSTENPIISNDSSLILHRLKLQNAQYLIEDLEISALFFLSDIKSGFTYWVDLQTNPTILNNLKIAKSRLRKSITIKIPTSNKLPDSISELLKAVSLSSTVISTKTVLKADLTTFIEASKLLDDSSVLEEFKRKTGFLKYEEVEILVSEGKLDEAEKKVNEIYVNPDSNIEVKFGILFQLEQIAVKKIINGLITQDSLNHVRNKIAKEFLIITEDGPDNLKIYAILFAHARHLTKLSEQHFNICVNLKMHDLAHKHDGILPDPVWMALTYSRKQRLFSEILEMIKKCQDALIVMLKKHFLLIYPYAAYRIAEAISGFIPNLRIDNNFEVYSKFKNWIDIILELAIKISINFQLYDQVCASATSMVLMSDPENEEDINSRIELAERYIVQIPDQVEREKGLGTLERIKDTLKQTIQGFIPSQQLIKDFYLAQAKAFGIDMDDDKDQITQIVNIGIKDLNPERVLKNCIHLFVKQVSSGMPARWLGLPTAGFKEIICTLHGHGISALSLDSAYELLKDEYCSKCTNSQPHLSNWKWNMEWQKEQHEKYVQMKRKRKE